MITRVAREVIYESEWVNLYRDQIRYPDGRLQEHHLVSLPRTAVGVLLEDGQQRLALVKVDRYPTGQHSWEIPAGRLEDGEDPLETAFREALEETGYQTHGHTWLRSYHPMSGVSNQVFHLVHARAGVLSGLIDAGEVSECAWFERAQALEMIRSGEIVDGLTLTGLLYFLAVCDGASPVEDG